MIVQRLGWTLLHFLWQGTAIAAIYGVLRGLIGRSLSSQGRYVMACLTLVAMTVTPLISFFLAGDLPGIHWSLSESAWQEILPGFVVFWIAGVLVCSLRLFAAWKFTSRLRSTAHPAPAEWQNAVELCAARPVRLLVSSIVDVPTVIGWLEPAIFMPLGALTGLPADHIRALLAHEMAHVRRHDYLASILQSVAESVLFYHPAVWWVSEQIRLEREACCDDVAVAACGDVATYVHALAGLESLQMPRLRHAPAANGGSLVNRIRRLAEPEQPRAENLPAPAAAWAMTLLWLAGIGVASVHAAPAVAVTQKALTAIQAGDAKPSPLVPAPVSSVAGHARKALLFDPFLTAQLVQPQSDDMAGSPWRQWLNEDVVYIISAEERIAFLQLKTDEQRSQFAEEFWWRRDPTPGTSENKFKQEHYRRIEYANRNFGSATPGWKTDRGRIYITLGPPDQINMMHFSGNAPQFDVIVWNYRRPLGLGNEFQIRFNDLANHGEFRLAEGQSGVLDPAIQAATTPGRALIFRPPPKPINNRLPMAVRSDYLKGTTSSTLANITVRFDAPDRQFQEKNAGTFVNMFGRITSMTRRPITTFEPTLEMHAAPGERASVTYQQTVPLIPGRYLLNLVAKDPIGGDTTNYQTEIEVPHFDEGTLGASSLILADSIEKLPSTSAGGAMFVIGDDKVRPRVGGMFSSSEKMGVYLQIYNFGQDEKTQKPAGSVEYEVDPADSNEKIVDVSEEIGTIANASASQVTVMKLLPLAMFKPGAYTLKVTVTDRIGKQTVERQESFTVSTP